MNISENGLNMVKEFEGLRLESYQDQGGIWTLGYGTTGYGIKPGMTCTPERAEEWLRADTYAAEMSVNKMVGVPLKQGQFDALVDFVYNLGSGALAGSELLKKLNAGDMEGAANEFPRWNHVNKKVVDGLTRRRLAEKKLFMEGM